MNNILRIVLLLILVSFNGCIHQQLYPVIDGDIVKGFKKNYNVEGLFNHFPKYIEKNIKGNIFCVYLSANILPESRCDSRKSEIVMITEKDAYPEELNKVLNDSVEYTTEYFNTNNILINISELKKVIFPDGKCNRYYSEKLPIPYFERYDFGLGEKETKEKYINGKLHVRTYYKVPKDLKVYVINAKAGDFWKFECDKDNRPETLKKWKHGYSRGVAVSTNYNKVVFWVIVW